ncbi:MAG TPA: ArsI/CadI family heavy metal resistance metalloenzyme [Polyangia bacterium]|nr:ArsI/CadI family heavy metal resistance metalloenzyme [Polyangia bacterium]
MDASSDATRDAGTPKVHVHLQVSDLAQSRAFYERFFGAGPVKATSDYLKFRPDFAPINLALSTPGARTGPSEPRLSHLGIQVGSREQLRAQRARIAAAGLPIEDQPAVDCCYANQDKFWLTDPDGLRWEVYHLNYDLPLSQSDAACCRP